MMAVAGLQAARPALSPPVRGPLIQQALDVVALAGPALAPAQIGVVAGLVGKQRRLLIKEVDRAQVVQPYVVWPEFCHGTMLLAGAAGTMRRQALPSAPMNTPDDPRGWPW